MFLYKLIDIIGFNVDATICNYMYMYVHAHVHCDLLLRLFCHMPNNRCLLQIHGGSISAVACVNNVVFTASADGTVKVWDTDLAQV